MTDLLKWYVVWCMFIITPKKLHFTDEESPIVLENTSSNNSWKQISFSFLIPLTWQKRPCQHPSSEQYNFCGVNITVNNNSYAYSSGMTHDDVMTQFKLKQWHVVDNSTLKS